MTSCDNSINILQRIECFLVNNLYLVASLEIVLFLGIIYYIYKHEPFDLVKKHGSYIISFILFIGFLLLMYFYFLKNRKRVIGSTDMVPNDDNYKDPLLKFIQKIFAFFGISICGVLIITAIFWLYNNITILSNLSFFILLIVSVIIILGFIYIVFNNLLKPFIENKSPPSLFTFIIKFLFYIPCILLNFIDYTKKQYNITTKPVWVLFIVELILITLYFLIPFLVKNISLHEGKQLLKDPVYTNNLTTLGTYENLSNKNKKDKFQYNYGLSFWLYINPQPPNTSAAYTTYTSLLNYGNKPNVLYYGKNNSLKVVCQNKRNDLVTIYETTDIKYQKWMHFIINYDSGTMDVFINKNLVASKSGIAPFMTFEKVTAGQFDGVNGGIKDVLYFNRIIPPNQIMLVFNLENDNNLETSNEYEKIIKKGEHYISEDYSKIKKDISEIKSDVYDDISKIKSGVYDDISKIKSGLRKEFSELDDEFTEIKKEL
jgi:hypothetical protein